MKILQLELIAFGLFTDQVLDFSAGNHGLHLIYGANEAGKSTMRRALTHLLFGIPERTADAYLHTNDQLRIGAKLQNNQGEELLCYRRKGRKNTLLDATNKPLDEAILSAFLGGMNETRFSALFCFDHDRLRQGGEDLLRGGGNVGESLFEAGSGSVKIHEVLAQLDKEAEELFKARGTKPLLNQTIRLYKEAAKRIKDHSLSANSWSEQAKQLDTAQLQHVSLTQELQQLRTEQHRLERIQRTRPLLQRHQELQDTLAQLTQVILLPADATTKRLEVNLALHHALTQEQQTQQEIVKLDTQLATIVVPEQLLAHKTTVDDLRGRLGSHHKAAQDLPGIRTEMRTVEAETLSALQRIYSQLDLSQVNQVRPTTPQRDRINSLAEQLPTLQEQQRQLNQRLEQINEQLTQQHQTLAALPVPPVLTELQAALAHGLRQGELEDSIFKEDKELRLFATKLAVGLKQLGLWTGTLELLEAVALPGLERIDSFDRRFKEIEHDQQRIKERLLEARRQYQLATQEINNLRWVGEVPTETALSDIRHQRLQYWQKIKIAVQLPLLRGGNEDLYQNFEQAMQQADEIADRLRYEAQRVADYGRWLVAQQSAQRDLEQQQEKWRLTEKFLAKVQQEWEETWKPLAFKPWSPTEMRTWLTECLNLRQQFSVLRERRHQLNERQQLMADLAQDIRQALTQLSSVAPLSRFSDLVKQGQQYVTEVMQRQRTREYLEREINNLTLELQRTTAQQQPITEALTSWHGQWAQALAPLQLPAETAPETARKVLATLDQVSNKIDKVNGLRRRVESIERDAHRFRQEVATLANLLAPELIAVPAEQVVPELSKRLNQAEKDLTRYEQLQQRLHSEQQRQQQAIEQGQRYQAHWQALLEQAHCQDLTELEAAEQASSQKQAWQRECLEVEQQLREYGEGLSLTELAKAVARVEIDQLPVQLTQTLEQLQHLEQQRSEIDQYIGEQRTLLKQMDGNAGAAKAADEAQQALAEMQQLSERYMQLHLAASVLRQAIEKYREQNQGPLLRRASELFRRFTLGMFGGLKTDYQSNDQPILLGLRNQESAGIPTSGMSDGSRDQLYLALRLASIEHYLQKNSALPLILDDILINFDDERSKATLAVLGELSQATQVLFFTHHPRLIELAQIAVPEKNLIMHQV